MKKNVKRGKVMEMRNLLASVLIAAVLVVGCDDDAIVVPVDEVPATPQGVSSVTGDGVVLVFFNGIYETDVKEYIIWRSLDPVTNFAEVGVVAALDNPNLDLIIYQFNDSSVQNGATYYYAVSAVDFAGQVSDLSAENVFDTPRPDGQVILVSNEKNKGNFAAFALASATVVDDSDVNADIFIDQFNGINYINAGNDTSFYGDIQDMGFTADFDVIGFAPDTGWSSVGFYELVLGHTYVIRTFEGNYAKMRLIVLDNNSGLTQFDWAYQTVVDNGELAPARIREGGIPRISKKDALDNLTALQ